MKAGAPKRVMIVEDSTAVRTLLVHIISHDPRLTVVAAVASAEEAIAALPRVQPDVISMDIQLPGMDGLEATRRIMADRPTPIVVISASIDGASLASSMDALRAGALSVVEKPVGFGNRAFDAVAREICTQLAIMSDVAVVRRRIRLREMEPPGAGVPVSPRMLLCAASTGGPQAVARLFGGLPADLMLPTLLVQHMGEAFMEGYATWLQSVVPQRVAIAEEGGVPMAGTIHVAPGGRHLRIGRDGRMRIGSDAPVGGQRPAATALFQSAADALSGAAIAVVLTGMGEDGADGVRALISAGGAAIAEHESSAVVYGMPAAAVRMGALALPIDRIGAHLERTIAGLAT
ncbi:chemotaxis protein CheB [Sphingomonas prati]|uniref:protein-glutamate methylesterase n=1 Tax=Sphingomonas prati TaxID=1843237 RepID=A0A7W9BTV9_9SPHN|nr:chemotaxis protein CheB [Sphingomonas prati]MBB5729941.1 two-component system chemotaxis response regulator CheB [Sphingomonas prati]GGE88315.1 chemotaxis response regulator protein-glutamate methylesterase of group 3 operon [Sphingomonas prati]